MSCVLMSPDSLRKLGHTLADILNASAFSIATSAAAHTLKRAFGDCITSREYSGEKIAATLYRINAMAYAGRYREGTETQIPPSVTADHGSLYRLPGYNGTHEAPKEWLYHLVKLLDCWLYQTAEDTTVHDETRQALERFSTALMGEIIRHTVEYNMHRWGT